MVLELDNIKLPPVISSSEESFADDTTRRSASGRLITKLAPSEKWRVTISFESEALSHSFQADFYNKCSQMRREAKPIKFISPYDGSEITILAKCTQRDTPELLNIFKRRPGFYIKAGAVFEEV